MCYVSWKYFDWGKAFIAEFQHFLLDCKVCEGRDHVYIIHDGIPKLWHLAGHVVAFK